VILIPPETGFGTRDTCYVIRREWAGDGLVHIRYDLDADPF
jgi:hypothetical protein